MIRDIITNKWILGCIALLIIIAGGCYFWDQHQLVTYKKEAAELDEFVRQWEKDRQAQQKAVKETETVSPQVPAENTSAAAPNSPELPQIKEIVTSDGRIFVKDGRIFFKGKTPPKMTPELLAELGLLSQDEIISPYGFGPYPELPEGFGPITWPRDDPNDELMIRMEIELLNQGVPVEGIAMENGLIYPIIKGVRYVRWGETSDGRQYLRDQLGHPDDREYMNTIEAEKSAAGESETAADFPGIQLIPMEEGGIDPYTFLNLPK